MFGHFVFFLLIISLLYIWSTSNGLQVERLVFVSENHLPINQSISHSVITVYFRQLGPFLLQK